MKYLIILLTSLTLLSFSKKENDKNSYVIEVTTYKIKASVSTENYWIEDAKVDTNYTSKQPGYISRESAYNEETKTFLVVAKWKSMKDAEASMTKFMKDESVAKFANMIDGSTMKMSHYLVK
ncbi:MAG: hypothetical protein WBC43_06140 [Olleya sp.]